MQIEPPKNSNIKFYRNIGLDGFRGVGCLIVMLGHTQWQGRTVLPGAIVAMDLFFVLSGFLISGLILAELKKTNTISLWKFWQRRAIRLLPAFYVYYAIVAVAFAVSHFKPMLGTDPSVSLISTAFYFSNWAVAKGYDLGVFFVTWSLSLEEQFYFLCPLIFLLLFRICRKTTVMYVFILAILSINLHRYFLFYDLLNHVDFLLAFKNIFYRLDTRADALMIGCFGAVFFNLYGDKIKFNQWIAIPCMIILFGLMLFVRDIPVAFHLAQSSPFTDWLIAGGFSLLSLLGLICNIHLVQFPESYLSKFFSINFFVRIGIMSYSIYLWHTTVFGGLEIALQSLNQSLPLWILKTLIRFATAILIGFISFRFVEGPALKYLFKKQKFTAVPQVDQEAR